jgi:tape measure domain-containing protein
MMSGAVLRTLAVRISANTAQFRKDIDKVDRRFKRFSSGMRREAMMFQGQMAALGATVATGFGVAEVARAADEMVNLRNKMGATFDTTREVANGMLDIKRIAKESRSELDSVGTLYQRIAVSTKSLGTSQEDVAKVTQVVANSFLMSGTTASEAANSARQFAQGLASGTLRGDEFRSVSENNVVLTQMLAEGLGMTVGQLRLFAQEGGLTAETIIPILTEKLEGTNTAIGKMSLTLGQAKTLFRNAFVEMVDRLNQTFKLVPKVAQAIAVLADNVHIVTLALAGMATLLLGRLLVGMTAFTVMTVAGAVVGLGKFAYTAVFAAVQITTFMVPAIITLTQRIMVLAGTAIAMLIQGLVRVGALMLLNPVGLMITGIAMLAAGIAYLSTKFNLLEKFGQLMEGVSLIGKGVGETIVNAFKRIPLELKLMGRKVVRNVADIMDKLKMNSLAAKLRGTVGNDDTGLNNQIQTLKNAPGANFAAGQGLIDQAMDFRGEDGRYNALKDVLAGVGNDVMGVMGSAGDAVMGGAGAAMDALPNFADIQTGFTEFVSGVGTSALDAIPGFRSFWAALRGDTDPDAAAAGPAPAQEDVQMSWAERWQLAIEKVKESFGTLSMAVKGRVNAMVQSYATFDSVLQAGARSSKKIAALNRALALKEAIVMQGKAIMNAWGAAPFPANLPGVALTTAQTALVLKDIMKGQAHDGMDSLPSTGTYMLEKGERVVSSRANRDLTSFLADRNNRPSTGAPLTLQINGVADPDLVFGALEQRRNELTDMIRSISDENLVAPSF